MQIEEELPFCYENSLINLFVSSQNLFYHVDAKGHMNGEAYRSRIKFLKPVVGVFRQEYHRI